MHTLKKSRQSRLGSFIKKGCCQAKKVDIRTLKKSRQSRLGPLLKFLSD